MMWALFIPKPTETINYDKCRMRRYRRKTVQWEEKSQECMKDPLETNEMHFCVNCLLCSLVFKARLIMLYILRDVEYIEMFLLKCKNGILQK